MNTKNTNTYLEERLHKELTRKLDIAKNITKIPTSKDILEAITQSAERCYWITDDYHTAFTEYQNLRLSARATLSTTGGAQKLFMELSMLLSKHRNMLRMREQDATRFNNAHEIYETLATGGLLDEIERVSSITELANRKPQDTSNGVVNPHYERLDVIEMFKLNHMRFMELLEDEEEEVNALKAKILKKQQSDEEDNSEIKKSLNELKEITQSLLNSRNGNQTQANVEELKAIEQAIAELRKGLRIQDILHTTRDNKIENLQESINTLARMMEENNATLLEQLTKNTRETIIMRTVATQTTNEATKETHSVATQVITADRYGIKEQDIGSISLDEELEVPKQEKRPTIQATRKRQSPDIDVQHELHEQLRNLQRITLEEASLTKKMKYTTRNYGARIRRTQDLSMECVFCGHTGHHYSDSCPVVRKVTERREIIHEQARCHLCLTKHVSTECTRSRDCFYCKDDFVTGDHHSALCPKPEEMANIQWQIRKTKKSIESIQQRLRQQGDDPQKSSQAQTRHLVDSCLWGV